MMVPMNQYRRLSALRRLAPFIFFLILVGLAVFSQNPGKPESLGKPPAAPGNDSQYTIAVKSELVVVPVNVTDSSGDFISGLNRDQFHVSDEGKPQKVTIFQQEDSPVTVGLVVDHSRSMGPLLPTVAEAVYAFSRSSNPQDEMFTVGFNDDVVLEPINGKPFTSDGKQLEKAVLAISARGRTALYDAIVRGIEHLQLGRSGKKALVIVSDGGDNASKYKYGQVVALAQQARVSVYCIIIASDYEEVNPTILQKLSKQTGGLAYIPKPKEKIEDISTRIARDLRQEYTLGFVPERSSGAAVFHRIKILVDAPGHGKVRVRTRPGYFTSENKPPVVAQTGITP